MFVLNPQVNGEEGSLLTTKQITVCGCGEEKGKVSESSLGGKGELRWNPKESVWANMVNCWEPEMVERRPEALMAHTQAQWEMFRNKPNKFDALWPLCPIDCVPS
ncbi:hypothetical protein Pcinc_009531 [Petrolisthes cinctipes]|uniref:Uncharacterized protein n=1 Tax=Petrolisthes cinctipes TaxID=88211 RepID=A0AAE1KWD1_PETCI|nr:hypothetical protein Pcinc_009531 [Petrolisthes cinctipes]